jgi:NADPH:quinone reductase-like Zn-dependent oxidoreductase
VASYVIPIAKKHGLRVLADAGPEDEQLVREFGADLILERGDGFPAAVRVETGGGADAFFDAAALGPAALPAIRDGGALATVRPWPDEGKAERGIEVKRVLHRAAADRTDWLDELRALAAEGTLRLRVAATFAPEDAAEAHRMMQQGGIRGRAVITF